MNLYWLMQDTGNFMLWYKNLELYQYYTGKYTSRCESKGKQAP